MSAHSLQRATASVTIRATPERAFDAWLDPAVAVRFLAAGDSDVSHFESDPREGGAFRILMASASGALNDHTGHYVVIERPRRLVFTWISAGTEQRLSLVTVTFTATTEGVRVDLEHEGLLDDVRAGQHARGWASILAKLVDTLA